MCYLSLSTASLIFSLLTIALIYTSFVDTEVEWSYCWKLTGYFFRWRLGNIKVFGTPPAAAPYFGLLLGITEASVTSSEFTTSLIVC